MTGDIESKILKKLAALEKREGDLPPALRFYRDLLTELREARPETALAPVPEGNDAKAIRGRLERGVPLLSADDMESAAASVLPAFTRVQRVFRKYPQLFTDLPGSNDGKLFSVPVIKAWFTGESMPPSALNGTSEATVRAMVHYAFKPLLEASAAALSRYIDAEKWLRSYCPVCGGLPDMAYLDRERGSRWLVCSRCDFNWLFPRLRCPYCESQDQNALAFFTDEEGVYRLQVCEQCKCYLKTIDLRKTEEEVLVPLERLLTGDLDRQAREEGYRLPG